MARASMHEICVAVLPGPFRGDSRRCDRRAKEMLATIVPLCTDHAHLVRLGVADQMAVKLPSVVHVHTAGPAVVYYIGDPATQCVKIGTSTDARKRLQAVRHRFPEAILLAVEPGHFELERVRHRQFAGVRRIQRGQREWFEKTPDLMDHINAMRHQYGDPVIYQAGLTV